MNNAFILINCDENYEEDTITKLKKIRNVEYVQKTMGAYDLVVKLKAENNDRLKDTIKEKN